ncbi:hypothetical protein [Ktedonospora formicarum]|uniref:Uncharacterized protein n=1 Tax=Ktedonospora formicarum TaxID=2778364 RepID=A0A8J3MVZ5_9CHLR|nr:hypothetical protein [Ktedonospora formicarum]GHO48446.1 hypothetical protein KSX_66090 [Ktedonospora formicarum]
MADPGPQMYRPIAHPNTFKSRAHSYIACSSIELPLNGDSMITRMAERARIALASDDYRPRPLIWSSAMNAEAGVIISISGDAKRCLCQLGYPASKWWGQDLNLRLHVAITSVNVSFNLSLHSGI